MPHVAIVGGGLAGITAGLELLDAGVRVTMFERRAHLGGATWSFDRNGRDFDNGQHVYLRCCTAYRRLLDRLGTADDAPLQDRLRIPVLVPRPGDSPSVSVITRSSLPPPLHLGRSLASYRHLSVGDRLRLGEALRALLAASVADPALDHETFGDFLRRHGQRDVAITRLWDLITLPTTNLRSDGVSAAVAIKVFKTGLLEEADAADIGWSRVSLQALHGDPAMRLLLSRGAKVETRATVDGIVVDEGSVDFKVRGVLVGGSEFEVDAVVLAVPHTQAAALAPKEAKLDVESLLALGSSPIVDVHLVYARKVMDYEIAAALDSPVQFIFDATAASGDLTEGVQSLAISVSGADNEIGERPEVLIDRYKVAVEELFPLARTTELVDAVVSREHHATFRAAPGTAAFRPGPATALPNLFLAGSWTDTGWPATMEGAVRSGNAAAWHVRRAFGERPSATSRDDAAVGR
jgi:squalene-associated FAD-dependent desaturase